MELVETEQAPAAIGPYSQAIISNGLIFCSGQIALRPDGTLVEGSIEHQTKQIMENLAAVLEAAGSSFSKVVKTTIYLRDMNDFEMVNDLYANYFEGEIKPARATVEVSNLPKGVALEIDCVAEV